MKMKKLLASGLALSLLFGSSGAGFAEGIDLQYAEMLRNKMATMNPADKARYEGMLQVALYDANTLQATINSINSTLTEAEKAALASKGISNDYIINSLQTLKTWSQEDRFALISAAKSNDLSQVESLNSKNKAPSTPEVPPAPVVPETPATPSTPVTPPNTGNAGSNGSAGTPSNSGASSGTAAPVTPTVPVTPTEPVVPPVFPKTEIADSALDQLLNSKEFQELINLETEATAKGSITSIANDSVVYTIRKGVEKSDFNLPEEIKNINGLIKVSSPKSVAVKLDLINMMVSVFGDQKNIAAHTKIQTVKDIKAVKATQINVSFVLSKKIIVKDAKGNIGASAKITRRDAAELINNYFKAMGIELAKDSQKQASMKDISKLKAADQLLMNKMVTAGIMNVDKTGKILPTATMTQAELSALVKKAYEFYLKNYGL